jgi:uncharacterized protein DUF5666
MRNMRTAAIILGAMLAVPMAGFAAPAAVPGQTKPTASKSLKPAKSTTSAASHSTRGVVKSVDSNSLVIERAGKKKKEMTFALDATTHREGDIKVGSTVAVRYKNDASKLMALDVQPVKAKAAARKAAAH